MAFMKSALVDSVSRVRVLPQLPVDQTLVDAATVALQGHERLAAAMRKKLSDEPSAAEAIEESNTILDSLRHLKSRIEGTSFTFRPLTLNQDQLALTRHLVVAHTPSTLRDDTKQKIQDKLTTLLKGQVKRVLYACIITCPWFAAAQDEISTAAKNNLLFVVYVASNEQFFSLATPHEKELCETIDAPPLFACEVRHLLSQALRGNVKCIEALCAPPTSVITSSEQWNEITKLLDPVLLLSRTFVDRCIGQAFGALVKKHQHKGKWVVRDDATLDRFSNSFKLLKYVESAIRRQPLQVWREMGEGEGEEEREILSLLKQAYDGLVHKDKLLQIVVDIKTRLEEQVKDMGRTPPLWTDELGVWLTRVRLDGVKVAPSIDPDTSISTSLRSLLDAEGLMGVATRDVVLVARGGSQMYGLALPTSDTDYIIVYKEPSEQLISRCTSLKESVSTRGQQSQVESASYEIRLFCEMLLKGAVNMFELMFADGIEYSSPLWDELTPFKESFMSEKVILQYIGFVKTHRKLIDSRKHIDTPRERKLFYQVFHKLLSLESYVKGGRPVVKCEGDDKEFIMRIRRGPLEGDLDREELIRVANERMERVREQLLLREKRYREFGDYRILQSWLLHARGIELEEPLKMVTPPL